MRRDITFHIRLNAQEAETMNRNARAMGLTTANYLRMLAMTHQTT